VSGIKTAAKAIIISDGRILVLKKSDKGLVFYVLPGGKQEPGESLVDAVKRECLEELNVVVAIERLCFIREYIGANHEFAGRHDSLHKVEFFFECRLESPLTSGRGSNPDKTQIGFDWILLEDLHDLAFYPATLKQWLVNLDGLPGPLYLGDVN
jgi:8-oxo-dGTP diphosphatase